MQLFSLVSEQSSRSSPEGALWGLGYELETLHMDILALSISMCVGDGSEH